MYFFYTLHLLISLFLIMVVLLQQGKGADLSVFGGGGTMTSFGARGAATLLHKLTVGGFIAFIITTLTIGVLQSSESKSTVMSGVEIEETADDSAATDDAATADDATADDAEPEAAPSLFEEDATDTTAGDGAADAGTGDDSAGAADATGDSEGTDTSAGDGNNG